MEESGLQRRLACIVLVAAVAVATGVPGCKRAERGPEPQRARWQDAKPITLSDLAGKVVLVNIWGPWCPPCRLELPHVAGLADKYRDWPDFRLLAVSYPRGGQVDLETLLQSTEEFVNQAGLHLPVYADPDLKTRNAFDRAGKFVGFPTTFVMDRQGVIRNVWVGFDPDNAQLIEEPDRWIAHLLQEKDAATPGRSLPASLKPSSHPAVGKKLSELSVILLIGGDAAQ